MAYSPELQALAESVRQDPEVQKYLKTDASPAVHAMFQDLLGEQNADINKDTGGWGHPLTKIPFLHPTSDYAPTETNIFGDLDRGRAVVQAGYQNMAAMFDPKMPMRTETEAFQRPREVPDLGQAQQDAFSRWGADKPLAVTVPLDMVRQPTGWASSLLSNPSNLIPMGAVERFGARALASIPGAKNVAGNVAQWAAKELPSLGKYNPFVAAGEAVQGAKPLFQGKPRVAPGTGGSLAGKLNAQGQPVQSAIGPDAIDVPEMPAEVPDSPVSPFQGQATPYSPFGPDSIDVPEPTSQQGVAPSAQQAQLRVEDAAQQQNIVPDAQGQLGFQNIMDAQSPIQGEGMQQFKNPDDPAMLRYLSQYFPMEHVVALPPSERLQLGNASAQELRDLASRIKFPEGSQMQMDFTPPPEPRSDYRAPVAGQGGQMEMNFGSPMKGKLSPGFDLPNEGVRLGEQRVADSLKRRATQGEQLNFEDVHPADAEGQRQFPFLDKQPLAIGPKPLGDTQEPIRDQGQGEFDFTKGPQESAAPVGPKPNMRVLYDQAKAEAAAVLKDPQHPRAAEFAGQSQDQILQALLKERGAGIKQEAYKPNPDEFKARMRPVKGGSSAVDPTMSGDSPAVPLTDAEETLGGVQLDARDPRYFRNNPEVKAEIDKLDAEIQRVEALKKVDGTKGPKAEANAARLKELHAAMDSVIGDTARIKAGLVDKTGKLKTSAWEDLKKIISGITYKKTGGGGLGSMGGNAIGSGELGLTPEATAALDAWRTRHAPELAAHLKQAGNDVAGYLKKAMPDLTDDEMKLALHYFTNSKIGNLNLKNLSPDEARTVQRVAETNVDLKNPTNEPPLSRAERVGRAGTTEAQAGAELLGSEQGRNVAAANEALGHELKASLHAIKGLSGQALRDGEERIANAIAAFNRAGTAMGRLLQSRKGIIADLSEYAEQSKILFEEGEITQGEMKAISTGIEELGKLPKPTQEVFWKRLHEWGVNSVLTPLSTLRNIAGNTIAAPLAPITKLAQAGIAKTVTRPINRLATSAQKMVGSKTRWAPFSDTETSAAEAGNMVKAYLKNFGTGARLASKYFINETDSGVYRQIQKDIARVTNDTELSPAQRTKQLTELGKQKDAVKANMQGSQETMREAGALQKRRSIPGSLGYHANTMTRALSATDTLFRYPMRKGIEEAIKTRLSIKSGVPLSDIKLSPDQQAEAIAEAAYYTFNQKLGKFSQKLQAVTQPSSAGGYAAAQVLMFMKNSVNVGKFALDHGALQTGMQLLDPFVGPLLNAAKNPGMKISTKALARSFAGMGVAYASYAAMKKAKWEFYNGTMPQEADAAKLRTSAKIPNGVFAIDASGNVHNLSQIYPATFFFGNMAAWDQAQRLAKAGVPEGHADWDGVKRQANTWFNATTLTGPKDVLNAWDAWQKMANPGDRASDEMNPMMRYLSKQAAARMVPGTADEANRVFIDKLKRDPNSFLEYLAQRTPGASQTVPPAYDWKGDPLTREPAYSPFRELTVGGTNINEGDARSREMLRLGVTPKAVAKSKDGIRFSTAERRSIIKEYGPEAGQRVQDLMDRPDYADLTAAQKGAQMQRALGQVSKGENRLLRGKIGANRPDFIQRARENAVGGRSRTGDDSDALIFPFLK